MNGSFISFGDEEAVSTSAPSGATAVGGDFLQPSSDASHAAAASLAAAAHVAGFGSFDRASVKYNADGAVTRPRNDKVAALHNDIIKAWDENVKGKCPRKPLTTAQAKDNEAALIFCATHTRPAKEPQVHAYADALVKSKRRIEWIRGGQITPLNLKDVLTEKELEEIFKNDQLKSTTQAVMDAFKSPQNRDQDAKVLDALQKSKEGKIILEFLVKVLAVGGRTTVNTAPQVLHAYITELKERASASPSTSSPALDPAYVHLIETASTAEELVRARETIGKLACSDEHARAYLRAIQRRAEQLITSGASAVVQGVDAGQAAVLNGAQLGLSLGGASITTQQNGVAAGGMSGSRGALGGGATFEETLAGLGHGTAPLSSQQQQLRAFGMGAMATPPQPAAGLEAPRRSLSLAPLADIVNLVDDVSAPAEATKSTPPPATHVSAPEEDDMEERLNKIGKIQSTVGNITKESVLPALVHNVMRLCGGSVARAITVLLVRHTLPTGMETSGVDAIAKGDAFDGAPPEFVHVALRGAVEAIERPTVRRKGSNEVTLHHRREFCEMAWGTDWADSKEKRKKEIAECLLCLAPGRTQSTKLDQRLVLLAQGCIALPEDANLDIDAMLAVEASMQSARKKMHIDAEFSPDLLAAMGGIVNAVRVRPKASRDE